MKQQECLSIARPYARAAFEFALAQNQLCSWFDMLSNAAAVVEDSRVQKLMRFVDIPRDQLLALFFVVLKEQIDQHAKNFLHLLSEHRRLVALPEIVKLFAQLQAEHEKIVAVQVVSALPLSEDQESRLVQALQDRLKSQVKLHCEIDQSILGGAIVRAKDFVIDGSGRTKLNRLVEYIKGNTICQRD